MMAVHIEMPQQMPNSQYIFFKSALQKMMGKEILKAKRKKNIIYKRKTDISNNRNRRHWSNNIKEFRIQLNFNSRIQTELPWWSSG